MQNGAKSICNHALESEALDQRIWLGLPELRCRWYLDTVSEEPKNELRNIPALVPLSKVFIGSLWISFFIHEEYINQSRDMWGMKLHLWVCSGKARASSIIKMNENKVLLPHCVSPISSESASWTIHPDRSAQPILALIHTQPYLRWVTGMACRGPSAWENLGRLCCFVGFL